MSGGSLGISCMSSYIVFSLSSPPIWCLFISFSYLIALARTPSEMVRVGIFVLFLVSLRTSFCLSIRVNLNASVGRTNHSFFLIYLWNYLFLSVWTPGYFLFCISLLWLSPVCFIPWAYLHFWRYKRFQANKETWFFSSEKDSVRH